MPSFYVRSADMHQRCTAAESTQHGTLNTSYLQPTAQQPRAMQQMTRAQKCANLKKRILFLPAPTNPRRLCRAWHQNQLGITPALPRANLLIRMSMNTFPRQLTLRMSMNTFYFPFDYQCTLCCTTQQFRLSTSLFPGCERGSLLTNRVSTEKK